MTSLAKMTNRPKGLVLVAVSVAALLYRIWQRLKAKPRNATVVPSYWILGNIVQMLRYLKAKTTNEEMCKWHSRYGQTFTMSLSVFAPWHISTTCPKNVEHILKTKFDNYPKGSAFTSKLAELLGRGIFNADGDEWHHQRKVSSHMFTAKLFKEHIWAVVHRNAIKTREILEATSPDKPVDIFNLMNRYTLDTIGEIGFGRSINSLEDPSSPFLLSFDRAQQIMQNRFVNPAWRLLRLLGVGGERETHMHMEHLNRFTLAIVRELRVALELEKDPRPTLLGSVPRHLNDLGKASSCASDDGKNVGAATRNALEARNSEARKSFVGLFLEDARRSGEELSETYLRDLVLNFLIAGRDTTAQALSWTIFCLSQHPEVATKVRREITDVCGIRGPIYEDMNRLTYLNAVLSEAMRLYPSVPVDSKVAANDDTLPDGTFVPRGTMVLYNIYSMGRNTHIWGDDANVFRPERWIEMKKAPTNYEYVVFNAGPRECLGKRLALVEMKTCLAMLLPSISFKLAVPADEVIPDTQLTIGMGRGLPCFVALEGKDTAGSDASTGACSDDRSFPSEGPSRSSSRQESQ